MRKFISVKKRFLGIFLVVVIASAAAAFFMLNPVRVPKNNHIDDVVVAVDVMPINVGSANALVELYGTVKASKSVSLTSEVSGRVVWTSSKLIPGGFFKKGTLISRIESADYEAAVVEQENSLAAAESALKVERGKVSAAEKEFKMMGNEDNSDWEKELMLRLPQLKSAETAFNAAEARLKKAKHDLARTKITAPFNSVIIDKSADVGMIAGSSTLIAEIAGTDSFWIELAVPVNQLKWIKPRVGKISGSMVKIYNDAAWGKSAFRVGEIIEIGGNLETDGRMARAIVEVKDPYSLEKENKSLPKMLINMFVKAVIEGNSVDNVAVVPRAFLRDGDKIWIATENNLLDILSPEIIWRGKKNIFIKGVKSGEKLIVSQIGTPVKGLKLSIKQSAEDIAGESE